MFHKYSLHPRIPWDTQNTYATARRCPLAPLGSSGDLSNGLPAWRVRPVKMEDWSLPENPNDTQNTIDICRLVMFFL